MRREKGRRFLFAAVLFSFLTLLAPATFAQYCPVYGGPIEYRDPYVPLSAGGAVNANGQAVVNGRLDAAPTNSGQRASRIDPSGTITSLGNLGTAGPYTEVHAYSVNAFGQAVGDAYKYVSSGTFKGSRPVRWDSSGNVIELGVLGFNANGETYGSAVAINSSGQATGYVHEYSENPTAKPRAVRWNSSGVVEPLARFGIDQGYVHSLSTGINDAGQVCGYAYNPSTCQSRAIRWQASGEADILPGLSASGAYDDSRPTAINTAGQVAGYSVSLNGSGVSLGRRPVRWESSGAITELETLGLAGGSTPSTSGDTYAMNDAGQVVGLLEKYVSGVPKGYRPVRWDASGAVVELDLLGTEIGGYASGKAYDINTAGWVVGSIGVGSERRAVCWRPDGSGVDLNSLIAPLSGWRLLEANAISDTGWIAGLGISDPDGAGPMGAYERVFLMQVPEPGTGGMLVFGGLLVLRRWRQSA